MEGSPGLANGSSTAPGTPRVRDTPGLVLGLKVAADLSASLAALRHPSFWRGGLSPGHLQHGTDLCHVAQSSAG